MKKTISHLFLFLLTLLLIINPQLSVLYAREGLRLCADIIVPSLFPFFVCSSLLIYSGFCEVLAKIFAPVMRPLFNINPSGAAAYILGIISGYPLGALSTCQLYQKSYLSKAEAERLLAFCNNSGPLFLLGAVGISMYHSPRIGIMLYASHILGSFTTGLVFRFYKKNSYYSPVSDINTIRNSLPEIFSKSISSSLQSILNVCGVVVFSGVASNIFLSYLNLNGEISAFLSGLFEFVSGLGKISLLNTDLSHKLLISSFICGFAGVSVHLQVMSVISGNALSLKPYILGKLVHAFFAFFYTYILLHIFPVTQTVFAPSNINQKISAGFFIGSLYTLIAVLLLCSCLILNFKRKK